MQPDLSKRSKNVSATIFTKNTSKALLLDLKKHNEQYAAITLKKFDKAHDRFSIIDYEKVYHIGASLKDLGKKWFAYTQLSKDAVMVIDEIKKIWVVMLVDVLNDYITTGTGNFFEVLYWLINYTPSRYFSSTRSL